MNEGNKTTIRFREDMDDAAFIMETMFRIWDKLINIQKACYAAALAVSALGTWIIVRDILSMLG